MPFRASAIRILIRDQNENGHPLCACVYSTLIAIVVLVVRLEKKANNALHILLTDSSSVVEVRSVSLDASRNWRGEADNDTSRSTIEMRHCLSLMNGGKKKARPMAERKSLLESFSA